MVLSANTAKEMPEMKLQKNQTPRQICRLLNDDINFGLSNNADNFACQKLN